jgi:hypothetical protein
MESKTSTESLQNQDKIGSIRRTFLYFLFFAFICVQVIEGVILNETSKSTPNGTDYTEYNFASTYPLDAFIRIMVSLAILFQAKKEISVPFKTLSAKKFAKLVVIRFILQMGELLSGQAAIMLTSASNGVIQNARIPLVGFLGYILYRNILTRDQYIYALTILPLVAAFTIVGANFGGAWKGYAVSGTSVAMVAIANVFVENILQYDLAGLSIWGKQLLNATIDFPIMCVAYTLGTTMEIYMNEVEIRSYNPFDAPNMANWYWVAIISINGAAWGFIRLSILNYSDALWLNLMSVSVMGIMWVLEVIFKHAIFDCVKLLILFSLTLVLIGYELTARDEQPKNNIEKPDI